MSRATSNDSPKPRAGQAGIPWWRALYLFLAGFQLATLLLLILLVLTWLATLEQVEQGLYPTLRKYFHWQAFYVIPELNGKTLPLILPGGYHTCALLLLNMTLGGIVRIKKGWRHLGNLISHFGIVFLLIGGGVAHHFSERGNMAITEGSASNTAEDYFEYVVEVAEVAADGRLKGHVHVIRGEYLSDLTAGKSRVFSFPHIPFRLELSGYLRNAQPLAATERAPNQGELIADGYWLMERPDEMQAEANLAAIYARVIRADGTKDAPFILAGASFYPFTVRDGERLFTVDMRKRLWPMPFKVHLDRFIADFHPGTARPARFVSEIRREEKATSTPVIIQMNEPMRHMGYTFFQASYGPPGAKPGEPMYSVFEIVKNPADKWPEWSLYIVTFGMLMTFLTKLFEHVIRQTRKRSQRLPAHAPLGTEAQAHAHH